MSKALPTNHVEIGAFDRVLRLFVGRCRTRASLRSRSRNSASAIFLINLCQAILERRSIRPDLRNIGRDFFDESDKTFKYFCVMSNYDAQFLHIGILDKRVDWDYARNLVEFGHTIQCRPNLMPSANVIAKLDNAWHFSSVVRWWLKRTRSALFRMRSSVTASSFCRW